jgi:hypothetical protein
VEGLRREVDSLEERAVREAKERKEGVRFSWSCSADATLKLTQCRSQNC